MKPQVFLFTNFNRIQSAIISDTAELIEFCDNYFGKDNYEIINDFIYNQYMYDTLENNSINTKKIDMSINHLYMVTAILNAIKNSYKNNNPAYVVVKDLGQEDWTYGSGWRLALKDIFKECGVQIIEVKENE